MTQPEVESRSPRPLANILKKHMNRAIRIYYVKAKINKTQGNSNVGYVGREMKQSINNKWMQQTSTERVQEQIQLNGEGDP